MPYRKFGNCMGDEGKAVGIAQAPAALLSVVPTATVLIKASWVRTSGPPLKISH
jgi:hypothetical protein